MASRIVKVSKFQSFLLHPVVIPMIFAATAMTIETEYMAKDGLSLWLCLMRNISSSAYSAVLDDLLATRFALLLTLLLSCCW